MKHFTSTTVVVIGSLIAGAAVSWGATITVDAHRSRAVWDLRCTLIEAIENANADAAIHQDCEAGSGADVIEFARVGDYTFDQVHNTEFGPTGLPVITGELVINGHGSVVQRRSDAEPFRLFAVAPGANLVLNDLGVANGLLEGEYSGAGILNHRGYLILNHSQVISNTAEDRGGGIANQSGTVTLLDSSVRGNIAGTGGAGIANQVVFGEATLIMIRSELELNQSGGNGGGLYNQGGIGSGAWAHLKQSTVAANRADGIGAGLFQEVIGVGREVRASIVVSDSTIRDNVAAGPGGGGIAAVGVSSDYQAVRVELRNSRVLANEGMFGAGIEAWYGVDLAVTASTVADNRATDGDAGGILVGHGSHLAMQRSTLSGNRAGTASVGSGRGDAPVGFGGAMVVVDSTASVALSTFSENVALSADGGAIYVSSSSEYGGLDTSLTLAGCTIADNRSGRFGGGLALNRTSGEAEVSVAVRKTILAENQDRMGGWSCSVSYPARIESLGFNLGDDNSCRFQAASDIVSTEVLLMPLEDNGGPTLTRMPRSGSAAIDSVTEGQHDGCIDQRGYPRLADGDGDGDCRCDRGAVEARAEPRGANEWTSPSSAPGAH